MCLCSRILKSILQPTLAWVFPMIQHFLEHLLRWPSYSLHNNTEMRQTKRCCSSNRSCPWKRAWPALTLVSETLLLMSGISRHRLLPHHGQALLQLQCSSSGMQPTSSRSLKALNSRRQSLSAFENILEWSNGCTKSFNCLQGTRVSRLLEIDGCCQSLQIQCADDSPGKQNQWINLVLPEIRGQFQSG